MSTPAGDGTSPPAGDGSGHSAGDIITYIGVPLAVLGVLPILYNTAVTIAALSRIKRMLRQCRLVAITRSDVVNRVIEVDLPRYAVTPLDRYGENSQDYWTLSRHPSTIPGGSWTTFNWRTHTIGMRTQRVEYADQLRQPQVEVRFDELVAYLLDLGAVPDPHGWRLLRSTGLWTPVGCALMKSPDGRENALTVAPLDDSDGHLSLAVAWSSNWTTRDHMSLPPYWVRLLPPAPRPRTEETAANNGEGSSSGATLAEDATAAGEEGASDEKKADDNGGSDDKKSTKNKGGVSVDGGSRRGSYNDSIQQAVESNASRAITCHISVDGLVAAVSQDMSNPCNPAASREFDSLYIDHLRILSSGSGYGYGSESAPTVGAGVWFASAATAYGTTSQTVLWNYRIPDDVLSFARRETVPCGALVLLGLVEESVTPEWATNYADDDRAAELEAFTARARKQREAMQREARMSPAERSQAVMERMRAEGEERLQMMREKLRRDNQRREQRMLEALQSPRWDARLVAEHSIAWLRKNGLLDLPDPRAMPPQPSTTRSNTGISSTRGTTGKSSPSQDILHDAVGCLLHRMVLDGGLASRVTRALDIWKAWTDAGGMRRADLTTLQENKSDDDGEDGSGTANFARASLLLAVVGNMTPTAAATDGALAVDLQECLRLWTKVRLG